MTLTSYCLQHQRRETSLIRKKYVLKLRKVFLYPGRMKWITKISTIVTLTTKNGGTSCPHWRLNTTGKELLPRSEEFLSIRICWIMIAMRALWLPMKIRIGLVFWHTTRKIELIHPIIKVISDTEFCTRKIYLPSKITHHKDMRQAL